MDELSYLFKDLPEQYIGITDHVDDAGIFKWIADDLLARHIKIVKECDDLGSDWLCDEGSYVDYIHSVLWDPLNSADYEVGVWHDDVEWDQKSPLSEDFTPLDLGFCIEFKIRPIVKWPKPAHKEIVGYTVYDVFMTSRN